MVARSSEMQEVTLTRDCPAVVVPWGTQVILEAGNSAQITQRLGGTFTILVRGNLYRVEGRDADALGLQAEEANAAKSAAEKPATLEEVEDAAWGQLATCYDPEIPIDIVNLGLIYACDIRPLDGGGFAIDIEMTLTAPGCGMGTMIADEARDKLLSIHGVDEVNVELVWDPPWSREMMSETARLEMGML